MATDQDRARLFSTCPQSKGHEPHSYSERVAEVARWSDQTGCSGMLIYTDNRLVDPWVVAQLVIEQTVELVPLVAVQPVYMHPYAVAKKVASLYFLRGRKVALNLVAGGFRNDLLALRDNTEHDERYERLVEYAEVVMSLLAGSEPVTYEGRYYRVKNLRLEPQIDTDMQPEVFVSGSSQAGTDAAARLGATVVRYPRPPGEDPGVIDDAGLSGGIRVGIIARQEGSEAWAVARNRFPDDRRGRITHELAMRVSDSEWHMQLSAMEDRRSDIESPYWLWPFENYATFCPYLVGSYSRVAEEIGRYRALGYDTFISDIPREPDDLRHAMRALEQAEEAA